jgi:hypothetical protein
LRVIFESGSKLRMIGIGAFSNCSMLESISIPPSVKTLCRRCFSGCQQLSTVRFEFGSQLVRVYPDIFEKCQSLTGIQVPSSLRQVFSQYGSLVKLIESEGK